MPLTRSFLELILLLIIQSHNCSSCFNCEASGSKGKRVSPYSGSPGLTYGCSSMKSNFDVEQNDIYDVKFGNEMPAINLNTVQDALNLMREFGIISGNFIKNNPYNDVNEFKRFYETYQKDKISSQEQFTKFYSHYETSYNDGMVGSNLVIEAFKKMNPMYQPYLYLCTMYENIPDQILDSIKKHFPDEIPNFFEHSGVAGVIKYKVNNSLGHILIDPALEIVKPVALSNIDNKFLQLDYTFKSDFWNAGLQTNFAFTNRDRQNYIVGETKVKKTVSRNLYFIKRPFCSILRTTAKIRLLKNERSIIQRSLIGSTVASLTFELHSNRHMSHHNFEILKYEVRRRQVIPFSEKINQSDSSFQELAAGFNMKSKTLAKTMEFMTTIPGENLFLKYIEYARENHKNLMHSKYLSALETSIPKMSDKQCLL